MEHFVLPVKALYLMHFNNLRTTHFHLLLVKYPNRTTREIISCRVQSLWRIRDTS